MGTKITKQVLAARLSQNGSWTAKQVEAYVDAFFNVLHEGVTNEGTVKLKGLGTFKTIQVADRASVDVNTGERIVIPGHQKLKFVEEDKVNALLNNPDQVPTEQPKPAKEEKAKPVKEVKAKPVKEKNTEPVKEERQEPVKEEQVSVSTPLPTGEGQGVGLGQRGSWLWALIALAVVLVVVGVIIALNSNNTEAEAATQPEQTEAAVPATPLKPAEPRYKIHHFQKGESLTTISVLYYGTPDSVERIQQLNGLTDSSYIPLGTELKLP
ncbi:MAG: HU family DNA-binding protein [Bacteroidaceae bacterium]|nr:HU family DNA-binding protein [Bacteroidaceae bacterium]